MDTRRKYSDLFLNKKLLLSLITLVFLLVTIPLSLSLISKRQSVASKAAYIASVNFPQDHAAHPNFTSEWWYLNLMTRVVTGTQSVDLGYILSFSRISGRSGLLTSRYNNSNQSFDQKTDTGGVLSGTVSSGYLTVSYQNPNGIRLTLQEIAPLNGAKRYTLTGNTPQIGNINLLLKERTVNSQGYNTPLLWGCTGNISVFAPNDTYYYSMPDLDVNGQITDIDGKVKTVSAGKAWFDHQWFNTYPPSDWKGHYWAGFHVTSSANLYDTVPHQAIGIVTQVYSSGPRYMYWVRRNTLGQNSCGVLNSFLPTSYFTNNYPKTGTITASNNTNNRFLNFNVNSFSGNQIMVPPLGSSFYEAASYFSGNIDNTNVTGLGFIETAIQGNPYSGSIPNCYGMSGPTTLAVGQSGVYSANVYSPGSSLGGEINYYNGYIHRILYQNFVPPNAIIRTAWAAPAAGTYSVCCRAWNDAVAECRPPNFSGIGGVVYPCGGPNSCMTVTVR